MHSGAMKGDIDWYRGKALASGGPVLEVGAGSGRVTIPIAESGIPVHALDREPSMLQALRQKMAALPKETQARIAITEGDMRAFAIHNRFPLAIIPFRAFLHNQTVDDQLACLRCVREHLRPEGELAFNVFHPSLEYMARHAGAFEGVWRWSGTKDLADGAYASYSEATSYDTVRQQLHSCIRCEEYGRDGLLARTFQFRLDLAYLYPSDIQRLLEAAGFDLIRISGSFEGRPLAHDGDELVVEARRRN